MHRQIWQDNSPQLLAEINVPFQIEHARMPIVSAEAVGTVVGRHGNTAEISSSSFSTIALKQQVQDIKQ